MGTALDMASIACSTIGWTCLILRLLPPYRGQGIFAVATGLNGVEAVMSGATVRASLMAACCAFGAWQWWNGGGGDGTKRRLRALGRAFRGVRRTAPVTGGTS
jgi:hypothetical protein